jgi:diacylglycerol kinase
MDIRRLSQSINEALRGLRTVYRSEQNFRLQLYISAVVLIAAVLIKLRGYELIIIMLLIGLVLIMELLNTALEYCADLLKPRLNHYVQLIKETMAAAVLVTTFVAGGIGLIIFIPHFLALLK